MLKFEDCIDEINETVKKRKLKWRLKNVTAIDWEDVEQILKLHIYQKWNLYDQTQPLKNWLNTLISNQLINLVRNNYGHLSRPCNFCPCSEGTDLCSIYNKQGPECDLYKKWEEKKKSAYNAKFTVNIDNHAQEVHNLQEDVVDFEKAIVKLNDALKTKLKPVEWKIYRYCYIDGLSDEEIGKKMGYTTSEKGRVAGYNTIRVVKKSIINKAKKIIYSEEMDII